MATGGARSLKQLQARAASCLPGGVNSNVRLETADRYFERAAGAWIWDVEGRDYVDYALGQGPAFLGHAQPVVNEAVARASRQGMVLAAQTPLEVEAAERLLETLRWPDRVRIGLSGSEAVHAVVRIARAVTGRARVVRFTGHYHGWFDNIFVPLDARSAQPASLGQPQSALDDIDVLAWDDAAALEAHLRANEEQIAAVIMEPVMLNVGASEPSPGYLEAVRELCNRHGTALIFDEVITGFRLAAGGAVERYGVVPDLATYGKAMAGGWPVSAFAGSARFMDALADGRVNHSGTFNGSAMASAAILSTLKLIDEQPPYEAVERYGKELMGALSKLAAERDITISTSGLPMVFHVSVDDAGKTSARKESRSLARELHRVFAEAGIWTTTRGLWFISSAHAAEELTATCSRAESAFDLLAGILAAGNG